MSKLTRIEEEIRNNLKRLFAEYLIRAGLPLGVVYPDREAYIIPIWAHQLCQLFPQPLDDKELREKIAKYLYEKHYPRMFHSWEELCREYKGSAEAIRQDADQILALLQPKIEEAKREEGKRIFGVLLFAFERIGDEQGKMLVRQALKGGE